MTQEEGSKAYSRERTLSNTKAFIIGRVVSAILTLSYVGLLVRALSIDNYAEYVVVFAVLESILLFSTAGLDWVVLRSVPEYVVHGQGSALLRFLSRIQIIRFASTVVSILCATGYVIIFRAPLLKSHLEEFILVASLLLTEGQMRLLRENALESLGAQPLSQLGIVLRSAVVLGCLIVWVKVVGDTDIIDVLWFEAIASFLVFGYSIAAVWTVQSRLSDHEVQTTWIAPGLRISLKAGFNNYLSGLLGYPYSQQALTLLVSSVGSQATVAGFGFVMRVVQILRGYLPALMFMGVLRPRLLGLYTAGADFAKVAAEARLASRLSTITLLPVVALLGVFGKSALTLASGGKFDDQQWILLVFVVALVPRVHRQISVVLVNCVNRTEILVPASLFILCGAPIFIIASRSVPVQWAAAGAVIWEEMSWIFLLVYYLRGYGFDWTGDWLFVSKAAFVALCSALIGLLTPINSGIEISLCAMGIILIYTIMMILIRPLSGAEYIWIGSLFRRDKP